jgi:Actin like proteins N terminal domain
MTTTLNLDVGNGTTLYESTDLKTNKCESGLIESCRILAEAWDDEIVGTKESPVVITDDGTYILGSLAAARLGQYNYAGDKLEQIKYFLYGVLPGTGHQEIESLLVAVPNASLPRSQQLVKDLIGKHQFVKNGEKMSANIRNARAVDESLGAYKKAIADKLFEFPDENNAVITGGVGTFSLNLYDPKGNKIAIRSKIINQGFYTLGVAIASAMKADIHPTAIMDAIAEDKRVTADGDDFSTVFDRCHEIWIEKLAAEMRFLWSGIRISQFLLVGGPVPTLQGYIDRKNAVLKCQRWVIPNDPQQYALQGMRYC